MDYVKDEKGLFLLDKEYIDINKINNLLKELEDSKQDYLIKEYNTNRNLNTNHWMKLVVWKNYIELLKSTPGKMYRYVTNISFSEPCTGKDTELIKFDLVETIHYKNKNYRDEIELIESLYKYDSRGTRPSIYKKVVILDIKKNKNNKETIIAHEVYNNKVIQLPHLIKGLKNKPEVGNIYILEGLIETDLTNKISECKINRMVKELGRVNINQYLDKFHYCCDYYYTDFNTIKKSKEDDEYYLMRFSKSIIKKYRNKYQVKMDDIFIDLDKSLYDKDSELEGKIFIGVALIHVRKINDIKRYMIKKLFHRSRNSAEIARLEEEEEILEAELGDVSYYDDYYGYDHDFEDCGRDSLTDYFIEHGSYDNDSEDFLWSIRGDRMDCEETYYMMEGYYHDQDDEESYFREKNMKEVEYDYGDYYEKHEDEYQEMPSGESVHVVNEREYIRKKLKGKYYIVNAIFDNEFITDYTKDDVKKCILSYNSIERIGVLMEKEKKKSLEQEEIESYETEYMDLEDTEKNITIPKGGFADSDIFF